MISWRGLSSLMSWWDSSETERSELLHARGRSSAYQAGDFSQADVFWVEAAKAQQP